MDDYNKVMGYAYIYASSTHTHVSDITISFVVTVHPRNLLNYLENDRKFTITTSDKGIYQIDGDVFPVQLLTSKGLSEEKNMFLKSLRSNLDVATAKKTVDAYKAIKEFESKNAYIYRLAGANPTVFKELMTVSDTAIREVVIRALAEEGGWLEERLEERDLEIARDMLLDGEPPEKVSKWLKLPLEKVKSLV